ncbi:hypothetical protein [Kurthia sibirica]|uniref:hypothetical protein n=1 Tax=Kurthia sibirica TaxID=202750 RepID=UPI00116D08A8|nr:hypothetical protein [Kurthia sibirica]GEK35450.1 hypothetical protein KSI01_29830 [Kurthia sibirica]
MNTDQLLNLIKRLKKDIEPDAAALLELFFPSLNEYHAVTIHEFWEAEQSLWNNKPNELAKKFMNYYKNGHIDDGGLVCFFYDSTNLWNEENKYV